MTHPEDAPQESTPGPSPPQSAEPLETPEELSCPVCDRLIPSPAPELCPHCQAPIQAILSILDTADLALDEAMRDLRSADLDSAERRIQFVRATSGRHRLKVEIIQAMIDRLSGDSPSALARLRAVQDKLEDADDETIALIGRTINQCSREQEALASCCEHYNFALYQAKRGYFEDARRSLRKALEFVPHHAQSHALMGKVQLAMQEEEDAAFHLNRALAVDPTNSTASRMLALMGRSRRPNPLALIAAKINLSGAWASSILIVIILIVLALVALLSR